MNKINELLLEVKKYTNLHESKSRESGEDFNVYKLCGIYHNENPHSDILAEFLDPKGSHGCGCDFFRAFCQTVGLNFSEYENAKVVREYAIEGGRFDILIEAGQNKIVIENKIYAGEGEGQLSKYREWLNERSGQDAPLFFLTLDGRNSMELPEGYIPISYKSHVISWLTECIRIAAEKPSVRESLIQYRNLVEELTKGNIMTINQELVDVIAGNFRSAITVGNYVDHVKAVWLWDNILKPLLAKEPGFTVDRSREEMIATHDVFLSYEDKLKNKKLLYAFNSYGFKRPRRELITKDENARETVQKSQGKDLPHNWDDDFFSEITPENAEKKAQTVIESIIRDKDNVLNS